MKNLIRLLSIALLICFCANSYADDATLRKKIIGKWYNPYTYENKGLKLGYKFMKNGTCKAMHVKNVEMKTWEIKDGKLYMKGLQRDDETSEWVEFNSVDEINILNDEKLRLITKEPFTMAFSYMRPKVMKQKITPKIKESKKK